MVSGPDPPALIPLIRKEIKMKKMIKLFVLLVFAVGVIAPVTVSAADKVKSKSSVVMKEGNKVHLFHSGTEHVTKEICLNDVISVYRETAVGYKPTKEIAQPKSLKEVGKVKVLSYVGDHYFEAEVVDGSIRTGDVAKKEGAYCLVQPAR